MFFKNLILEQGLLYKLLPIPQSRDLFSFPRVGLK